MVTGDAEGRAEMPGARAEGSGRYPREQAAGVSNTTVKTDHSPEEKMGKLMEVVVERENMRQAYSRVMRNKGAAGVDGMLVADLKAHLQVHWSQIKEELLAGRYKPRRCARYRSPSLTAKGSDCWAFRRSRIG